MTKHTDLRGIQPYPFGILPVFSKRDCAIRAACYIDTDGSIGLYAVRSHGKLKAYQLRCHFVSITHHIPYWLKAEYGGSVFCRNAYKVDGRPNRKRYDWSCSERVAFAFLCQIRLFVVGKVDQVETAIEYLSRLFTELHDALPEDKITLSQHYYETMRALKASSGELSVTK